MPRFEYSNGLRIVCVFAVIAVGNASSRGQAAPKGSLLESMPIAGERQTGTADPEVFFATGKYCGVNCVNLLVAICQPEMYESIGTMASSMAVSSIGTSASEIVSALKRHGLDATIVNCRSSHVRYLHLPAIVFKKGENTPIGHYYLLLAIRDSNAIITDGTSLNREIVPLSAIEKQWSGIVIILAPSRAWERAEFLLWVIAMIAAVLASWCSFWPLQFRSVLAGITLSRLRCVCTSDRKSSICKRAT